jgi:hypothetical protein
MLQGCMVLAGRMEHHPHYENGALPTELCQRNGLIDDGAGSAEPTRRAFSLTFRVGLYPLSGWCRIPCRAGAARRADLQQHEPPAGPSRLLADVPIPF